MHKKKIGLGPRRIGTSVLINHQSSVLYVQSVSSHEICTAIRQRTRVCKLLNAQLNFGPTHIHNAPGENGTIYSINTI